MLLGYQELIMKVNPLNPEYEIDPVRGPRIDLRLIFQRWTMRSFFPFLDVSSRFGWFSQWEIRYHWGNDPLGTFFLWWGFVDRKSKNFKSWDVCGSLRLATSTTVERHCQRFRVASQTLENSFQESRNMVILVIYIWDNPSHWLICFKMIKTTNQGICPQVIKHGLLEAPVSSMTAAN